MSRAGLGLTSALLCLVVSGCAGLAAGAVGEPPPVRVGKPDIIVTATPAPTPTPTPTPTPRPLAVGDITGSDGRLTVLILGSDARDGIIGERTDAIILASIDPETGRVAMASLPRDTVNVPIAPGKVHRERINSLYWDQLRRNGGKKKPALKRVKKALAYAFDTEIDYYALVDFDGVVRLVNSIGGVEVMLEDRFVDPNMHIGERGLRLKKGRQHLDGKTALAFSRSRKTSSDYDRSRRQQQVLAAIGQKVRARGSDPLPDLVELARERIVTDMPLRAAPVLLQMSSKAKLDDPKSVVLEPGRWARPATTYTIAPRVIEVRKMFDRVFKPVR